MTQNQTQTDSTKTSKALRDIFCSLIWIYVIIKLFVFDFDVYLFQTYLPKQTWLVDFKFVVLLLIISIYWLTVGNKKFYLAIAFLLFFPIYFLVWRVGRLIFRNWFAAFAAISYVSSFLQSFKFGFITFTIFVTASVLILASNNPILLILGMALLFSVLVAHFSRRVKYAFVPSKALVFPRKGYVSLIETVLKQYRLPPAIKSTSMEKLTTDQRNTRATNLQFMVIANRATTFIASKLKEFQESKLILLYFILGLLFTLFLTVVLFALINLGLHKIEPLAFSSSSPRGFLFFLYYSFNTILTNGIADFYPVTSIARLLNSFELLFAFLIIVILFFVYTNIKNDKAKEEMANLVQALTKQGDEIEELIHQEFDTNVSRAIEEIEKLPSSMIKIIYFFTTAGKE